MTLLAKEINTLEWMTYGNGTGFALLQLQDMRTIYSCLKKS
jgi:hypothetical protein